VSAVLNSKVENTVEATRGQPLIARVLARKIELEDALADCAPHEEVQRSAIQTALAAIYGLMTGDLVHPSSVVARALSAWLERHKYVAVG